MGHAESCCRGTVAASSPPVRAGSRSADGSDDPNGVYVVTTTVADLRAGGVFGPDFRKNITYMTTFHNGHWSQTQKPNYPDQGPFSGLDVVHGDEVTFIMLKAGSHGQNAVTAPETVKWSYFDRKLRFKIVAGRGP